MHNGSGDLMKLRIVPGYNGCITVGTVPGTYRVKHGMRHCHKIHYGCDKAMKKAVWFNLPYGGAALYWLGVRVPMDRGRLTGKKRAERVFVGMNGRTAGVHRDILVCCGRNSGETRRGPVRDEDKRRTPMCM